MVYRMKRIPLLRLVPTRQQRFPKVYQVPSHYQRIIPSYPTVDHPGSSRGFVHAGRQFPFQISGARRNADLAGTRNMDRNKAYRDSISMPLAQERKTVLIIGSSIAGTVIALQILKHPALRSQYRPILFDSAFTLPNLGGPEDATSSHPAGQSGAAVALTKQAMWPLRQLELGPELDEISQNTECIAMYRRPFFGPQDGSQPGVPIVDWQESQETGVMGGLWAIRRGSLQGLLIKNILARGGEVICNKKLLEIVEHGQCVHDEGTGNLSGAHEALFADGTSYRGDLVVGADGAWSTVRKHIFTASSPSGEKVVDEAWKPDFQNLQIVHGISHAQTTNSKPTMYAMGLSNVGTGSWTLKGNRQMWTIYEAPCPPPPSDPESRARSEKGNKTLSEKWDVEVFMGGYDQASTEAFMKRYRNVWHPHAGTFGSLFDTSSKIVRVGLWQKVFTRLGNIQWSAGERKPKECGKDNGVKDGRGNIVLIGDAARVLMPTAGQGAAFAIEDATVLADCLLNHPPDVVDAVPDFSTAIKEYTRQRLPRYERISTVASWGARIGIGRTWADRFARDYLAGLAPAPKPTAGERKGKTWREKIDSGDWLLQPKFEVILRQRDDGKKDC